MRAFEWPVEDIIAAYPELTLDNCAAMAVALMRTIVPPCDFRVTIEDFEIEELEGDTQFLLNVTWLKRTEANARKAQRTRPRTQIVEGGAIALAFLLFSHFIRDSELHVTSARDRADYWLTRLHWALEISGTERPSEMPRRHREKVRRSDARRGRKRTGGPISIRSCFTSLFV